MALGVDQSAMKGSDDGAELCVPVIIVGGGPVGMGLAMNLDALGVRSVIVNREPKPPWHPKGSTQNARTMEHYRRLGIAHRLRRLGLPADHPTDIVYVTRFNGFELQRLVMPTERAKMEARARAAPTDQEPEPLFRCNQMHAEAFLFEHVGTLPNVTMRFGWECIDWRDEGDGVSAVIEERATGRRQTLRGAYLAGCDGAHGIVRARLGIRYLGDQPERQAYLGGPMVSTYLRAPDLMRVFKQPAWHVWAINRDVRSNMVAVDGREEFLFNTRLERDDQKPDDILIARAFLASVGQDIDFDIIGHKTWTAGQALVAERFGQGRAVLAGDAIHLFTPTGGFGMNTGVDDAANLGWKLAALVQGWGGPNLLASYESERRPIALRNTGAAKLLARNVGAVPVGADIEADSPAGEADRREASAFLSTFGEEFASLGVQLGARYDGSPIVVPDGTPPADDAITYRPSCVPGGRAPHLWLADRTSLFDHFGRGFTLLSFGERRQEIARLDQAARRRGVPLETVELTHPDGRDLYACDFALVRPDQHVAWRGNRIPEDCDGLIGRVTGW